MSESRNQHIALPHIQVQQYSPRLIQGTEMSAASSTTTFPLLLDQISNFLTSAQALIQSAKEEREPLQNYARRNIRMQASPYQRIMNSTSRTQCNSTANNSRPESYELNFCNCNGLSRGCGREKSYIHSRSFQCPICLESYLKQRPMTTLCGHIFCKICILECLNRQGKCPICNRRLNITNIFRVFF